MEAVTDQLFASVNAILRGYARYGIQKRTYPGIIEKQNHFVEGLVYQEVDAISLQRLDDFEAVEYFRKEVTVNLNDGSQVAAYTYVIPKECSDILTKEDWDLERFKKMYLKPYLKHVI